MECFEHKTCSICNFFKFFFVSGNKEGSVSALGFCSLCTYTVQDILGGREGLISQFLDRHNLYGPPIQGPFSDLTGTALSQRKEIFRDIT